MSFATARNNMIEQSINLFSLLSRNDNLRVFLAAREGTKYSNSVLNEMQMTRKRYYRALKQLKDFGLIEKDDKSYRYTTFGKIIYQRHIVEVEEYKKYLTEMQMIDSIAKGEFRVDDNRFVNFLERIMGMRNISTYAKENENTSKKIKIVSTYSEMISLLLRCIESSTTEILIATRISPEVLINSILHRCKTGIRVKVLADTDLVKRYFKAEGISNPINDANTNNDVRNTERMNVVGNPWYPEKKVERRICKIPFGFIIIDDIEVGIEIINCTAINNFDMGILLRDENVCKIMKQYYQNLWDDAEPDIMKLKLN